MGITEAFKKILIGKIQRDETDIFCNSQQTRFKRSIIVVHGTVHLKVPHAPTLFLKVEP